MIAARPRLAFGRLRGRGRRLVHLIPLIPLVVLGAAGPACDREHGQIELNWSVVDRAGTQVAPFGVLGDTCNFLGTLPDAAEPSPYDLELRLRLCDPDCPAGCDDPDCQVETRRYDCSAARGFSTVDARAETPYDVRVDLVATPQGGACGCALTPPCALVPGPRRRTVEAGLVTDLQVYLLVLGLDNIRDSLEGGRPRLDLDACCIPDPTCA